MVNLDIFVFGVIVTATVFFGVVLRFRSKQTMIILLFIICGILLAWTVGSWLFVAWVEEPAYTVVEKRNGYEIREYPTYVVAETKVSSSGYDEASNSGFGIVADYIFGNNTEQEKIAMTKPVAAQERKEEEVSSKIAMTKPVIAEKGEADTYTIGFIMPSKYTLENLPRPNDNRVTLRTVPVKRVAALSFNGWYATNVRSERAKQTLLALLESDNTKPVSVPIIARYNPPLTMPLILRNEILVEIE